MKDISKKKKTAWQTCIVMILPLLTGIICGILFAKYDSKTNLERSFGEGLLIFAVWLAYIYSNVYSNDNSRGWTPCIRFVYRIPIFVFSHC